MKSYKHFGDQVRRNLSSLFKHFRVKVREGPKDWVKNSSTCRDNLPTQKEIVFLNLYFYNKKLINLPSKHSNVLENVQPITQGCVMCRIIACEHIPQSGSIGSINFNSSIFEEIVQPVPPSPGQLLRRSGRAKQAQYLNSLLSNKLPRLFLTQSHICWASLEIVLGMFWLYCQGINLELGEIESVTAI